MGLVWLFVLRGQSCWFGFYLFLLACLFVLFCLGSLRQGLTHYIALSGLELSRQSRQASNFQRFLGSASQGPEALYCARDFISDSFYSYRSLVLSKTEQKVMFPHTSCPPKTYPHNEKKKQIFPQTLKDSSFFKPPF